jgi:hypothetical protein
MVRDQRKISSMGGTSREKKTPGTTFEPRSLDPKYSRCQDDTNWKNYETSTTKTTSHNSNSEAQCRPSAPTTLGTVDYEPEAKGKKSTRCIHLTPATFFWDKIFIDDP